MRTLLRTWIVCVGVAYASIASAAPVSARAQHKAAAAQHTKGNHDQALELLEQGLAVAPKDRKLLTLKARVLFDKGRRLFERRDYAAALEAYEAYLAVSIKAANRREVEKMVQTLGPVRTTFLEATVANGPAEIFIEAKTLGVVCEAAPSCTRPWLPGEYDVIAERPGFEPWTGRVTVEQGQTTKLAITLADQPSLLTVRVAQPGARITVGGVVHDASEPTSVPAGTHQVVVTLDGHAEARLEAVAREGKPIALDVALVRLVPIRVEPPGAELRLNGKPIEIRAGAVAIPPGEHVLVVHAPGFQDRELEIPAERGPDYKLELELERAGAAVVESSGSSAPGRFTLQRKLALVIGGLGLVAGGSGVVLGLRAGQSDDGSLEGSQRRETRRFQSHLAYGAGGLAVAIAFGLWLDGAPGPRIAVAPRVGSAGGGIDLAVRF